MAKDHRLRHGHNKKNGLRTPTYNTWASMIQRCYNKKNPYYYNYGGRGIAVCRAWRTFSGFLACVGTRPHGMTLDRPDNSGNYSPTNWRWATKKVQSGNKKNSVLLTFRGKTQCRTYWARDFKMDPMVLKHRMEKLGWSISKALLTPRNTWATRKAAGALTPA